MKFKKLIFIIFPICLIAIFLFILLPWIFVYPYEKNIYFNIEDVPNYDIGIVFGAGIKADNTPSDMLKDRLITASELYKAGKIKKILVSGDNRFENYNEPERMYDYLVEEMEIPKQDIVKDYAGRRTYDTCVRAKNIFGINSAILITQEYHLTRALFTCNNLGLESIGFSATRQDYVFNKYFKFREIAAVYMAIFDVYVWSPDYIEGKKEEILYGAPS